MNRHVRASHRWVGSHPRTNPDCVARYHGTEAAYTRAGCRCPEAREERRIRNKRRRHGRSTPARIDSTGTCRRVRALAVLGWTYQAIGDELGCRWQFARSLASQTHLLVHVTTAARVADVYRRLSGTEGPSVISRRRALAKGWVSPLAWDDIDDPAAEPSVGDPDVPVVDEVAVRRVLDGKAALSMLTPAERILAARQWVAAGRSRTSFANTHGLSSTAVNTLLAADSGVAA
ncbi:MAG TPA: hypothetical protein VFC00_06035 [Micromonosporaceae bacterium]|nr:hypothetical protein [Micromonosporaceae bacterium]